MANRTREHNLALAKHLLIHYFRRVYQAAGITWDSDYAAEIAEIVDSIVRALEANNGE